ncbi:hypothetical protein JOM56_002796 [Amanita muscaria]
MLSSSAHRGMRVAGEMPKPSDFRSKSPSGSEDSETTPLPQPPPIKTSPVTTSSPRIAIIISSMYGHIAKMAEAAKQGVEKAGGQAGIFQTTEISPEILAKMHAPPNRANRANPDYPIVNPTNDLTTYDGYLFAVPTHSGNMPNQWKTLEPIWKIGKTLFKTFSCFFMLFQLYRMIMKSRESMKKLKHLLAKLLQLLTGWYSAFEASD